jgi:TonB-linked SusC/RagA family outer membrane protein
MGCACVRMRFRTHLRCVWTHFEICFVLIFRYYTFIVPLRQESVVSTQTIFNQTQSIMKKRLLGLVTCCLLMSVTFAFAQNVSGRVTAAADGSAVPGASVMVKGTTQGTSTDADGRFSLQVNNPSSDILVVSFIGYATQEIALLGRTTLNVTLQEDVSQLSEVVVTALGIEREKRELGYSVQDVRGDRLTESRDANIANSLAGKVAGVQIRQNGTGAGGSTRITIRGNNTIAGQNQPLVVVDGIPIDSENKSPDDYWGNSTIDKGSGLGDISPDDVESISVLKGPAAAALYGSRAANGVILVTTKTGKRTKGIGVTLNTNYTFDRPMQTPKFQNVYGQGLNGTFDNNTVGSWGPKMDGSSQAQALGTLPYSARDNDLYKDFLQTGSSWTNSVEFSKNTEEMTMVAGVTNLENKAIVPNSGLDRTSINLRLTTNLAKWLTFDGKLNYINQEGKNRISLARDPNSVFMDNLYRPRSVNFSDYNSFKASNWKRADGKPAGYLLDHNAAPNNVFWSAYRNKNSDERDRYIGMASLNINFTDWLTLKLRAGMDNYTMISDLTRATGNPYWEQGGSYRVQTDRFKETNTDFLLTAKREYTKFGVVASVGGNIMKQSSSTNSEFSGELEVPESYAIASGKEHRGSFYRAEKQINSLYGTVSLSYAKQLFVDFTARNDWSSTLPKSNNSYFYPSIGASWIFTESASLGPITFGKLRASWAMVGNDTYAYNLVNTYILNYNIKDGIMDVGRQDWRANPNLINETIKSTEVGLELLFGNRFGLDVTFYQTNAIDQVLKMDLPPATGFKYFNINGGEVRNRGLEVTINATPVIAGDFSWETSVNWSMNRNKILDLSGGNNRQVLSLGASPITVVAEENGSYGDMYGTAYLRDDNGNIIIDANGIPVADSERKKLGNVMPDGIFGWSNTLRYKNLDLGFLIDMNYGGEIYMGSINLGTASGTLALTEKNREGGLIVKGVQEGGGANTVAITSEQYWKGISGINEAFIYDATSIRFRELTLGYTLPSSILEKTPFRTIKAGIVARNLFMIYSKTEGFDPEATYSASSSALGMEYGSMPTLRSIGFNVKLGF